MTNKLLGAGFGLACLAAAACATAPAPAPGAAAPPPEERTAIALEDLSWTPAAPVPGPASTLRARLKYAIADAQAEQHLIVAQFPTRDGLAWAAPAHAVVAGDRGEVTLEIPLGALYEQPLLRLPLGVRFVLAARIDETLSRPIAETAPVPLAVDPLPQGMDSDLVLHLPFERDLADHSRNQHKVLAVGEVAVRDGAAELSGNVWLILPHLEFNRDFAVSMWIEPAGEGGNYGLVDQPEAVRASGRHLHLDVRQGRPHLGFYDNDLWAGQTVAAGEWTHLVFQYREGHQETWMDGRLVGRRKADPYLGTHGPTLLGHLPQWGMTDAGHFKGRMRQVRVYQRGLGAREVTALLEEGRPPVPAAAAAAPAYVLHVHAVRTANDDGSEETVISPEQVGRWVGKANQMLSDAGAGIRLQFQADPDGGDWEPVVRDSAFNHWEGGDPEAHRRAVRLAKRFPGKLVFIFRYAAGKGPKANRGSGFSSADGPLVVLPAFDHTSVGSNVDGEGRLKPAEGRTQNIWQMAHDLGHFLGLPHTFASTPASPKAVADLIEQSGMTAFDGDGLADTPPDIGPEIFNQHHWPTCDRRPAITYLARRLDGSFLRFAITTARHNVMSYFACEPMGFTPAQVRLMRRTLQLPHRRPLIDGPAAREVAH
jgi:hypothetical protein